MEKQARQGRGVRGRLGKIPEMFVDFTLIYSHRGHNPQRPACSGIFFVVNFQICSNISFFIKIASEMEVAPPP